MENFYTSRMHGFFNYSYLSSSGGRPGVEMTEESILSLISVLGSSISLVGLVFAFITYSLFSDLRNLSGTALMNLLAALFMTQLLYVIGVGGIQDTELCLGLAFALEYMRLTVFCWMLIMAYHMHNSFAENMSLLPPVEPYLKSSFFRLSLFGWGLPILLIGGSAYLKQVQSGNLLHVAGLKRSNCWFLDSYAFLMGAVVPTFLLLVATVAYLIKTRIVIRKSISIQIDKKIRDKMSKKRRLQHNLFVRLTAIISLVFGLGVLHQTTHQEALWVLYNVAQGVQGILVALCVTCNCHVLKIYTRSLRRRKHQQYGAGQQDLSRSTSLQMLTSEPAPDIV